MCAALHANYLLFFIRAIFVCQNSYTLLTIHHIIFILKTRELSLQIKLTEIVWKCLLPSLICWRRPQWCIYVPSFLSMKLNDKYGTELNNMEDDLSRPGAFTQRTGAGNVPHPVKSEVLYLLQSENMYYSKDKVAWWYWAHTIFFFFFLWGISE